MSDFSKLHLPVHSFHIPVMGLAYTIDTPLKAGRFGISSVVSVMDDQLIEKMRAYYSLKNNLEYTPIAQDETDARARRITAYLDLLSSVLRTQMLALVQEPFCKGSDLYRYYEYLASDSALRLECEALMRRQGREEAGDFLRSRLQAGALEVNIMTKVDKPQFGPDGEALGHGFSDAHSALRGIALSRAEVSIVFSAGMNPSLFSYCSEFDVFYPDPTGKLRKKIILKVSDFRSARIQGMFLAKKGLWVSEFRIESGLNCGGHAFATEGNLLGPVLEEFRLKREDLRKELFDLCCDALQKQGRTVFDSLPSMRLSAQGGIGTAEEHRFLLDCYGLDSVGWGSPFLLVPEVCNTDEDTLQRLVNALPGDYYLSDASPLGVPFNNLRISSSEEQRKERIRKDRPGSPCYKKFLSFNTEFGEALCTASRKYQYLKSKALKAEMPEGDALNEALAAVEEKDCLCEGLGAPALLKNEIPLSHGLKAAVVCPGPNLAYFTGVYTLQEMTAHIYGRVSLLNRVSRSHVFINELRIYTAYLEKEIHRLKNEVPERAAKQWEKFRDHLLGGIAYYRSILPRIVRNDLRIADVFEKDLDAALGNLLLLSIPGAKPIPENEYGFTV